MKKVLGLLFVMGAVGVISVVAHAASFEGEWNELESLPVTTKSRILKRSWPGNTAEQAADFAARECQSEIEKMQRNGVMVLSYRLVADATASPYIFAGNCDVRMMTVPTCR